MNAQATIYASALGCELAAQQIGGCVEVALFWAQRLARRSHLELRSGYSRCIGIGSSADGSCLLARLRHFLTAFLASYPKAGKRVLVTLASKHYLRLLSNCRRLGRLR